MKYRFLNILLFALLASGCKIDIESEPQQEEELTLTVQAVELESNNPIPGVTMALKKCTKPDLEFGCLAHATVKTMTTNDAGKITYSNKLMVEEIEAQHPKYWGIVASGSTIVMTPLATVKAHVKRIHAYPETTNLSIAAGTADCRGVYCYKYTDYIKIGLPADTVIYLNAFGNLDNQVSWYTTETRKDDSLLETNRFRINRFDTVSITISY